MDTSNGAVSAPENDILIKVDVTSDSICPFCYIGKRKLERSFALARERGVPATFEAEFKPFLLDPTLRIDTPVVKRQRYREKFGAERVPKMEEAMKERGKEVGINFSYGGLVRQTTDSHRLISLAYEKGGSHMQSALLDLLFNGYFEREQDNGDIEFLAAQSVAAGLFETEDESKTWLSSDAKKLEVARGIREAQMMGVTGVPFFVLNNKYAISGAEDPETFVNVYERLVQDARKTAATSKTTHTSVQSTPGELTC